MYTTSLVGPSEPTVGLSELQGGVTLQTLLPSDLICVRTRNSEYFLYLLDPETGRALLRGGSFSGEPIEVMVKGSTIGGHVVKPGWVGAGFSLEMVAGQRRITTSLVESLCVSRQTE